MRKLTILLIAGITLSSFIKPEMIQRRKGIMNIDEKGKMVFTPLEDWHTFTPKNDTIYQYSIK